MESVNIKELNDRIQKEFVNFKVEFQEFSLKQQDNQDKIADKLSSLEINLENFNELTRNLEVFLSKNKKKVIFSKLNENYL